MPNIKLIITILNSPRMIFHLIFFIIFYNKIKDDVCVAMRHRSYNCGVVLGFMYLLVFDKTYRNLFYYRIGKWHYLIYYIFPPHDSFVIATKQEVGKGFLCIHPIATFVNAQNIGRNFVVKNSCTIGENRGRPKIGNNVIINANSVVVGDITIGNNVVVGTGTVLMKSVPDDCVVIGNPAYIKKKDGKIVNLKL